MSVVNKSFDMLLNQWYADVYRFCFLMSCHGTSAREIAFQTFLYAGADDAFPEEEGEAAARLFSYAAQTCEDYYLRRLRRRPSRKALEASISFPVSDALWSFLKKRPNQKAVLFLQGKLGFTPLQTGEILGLSPARVSRLFLRGATLSVEEMEVILPDQETAAQVSDELYLRFEERNVKLENKLRLIRLFMDKAILWIALGLLALFAAAARYAARL